MSYTFVLPNTSFASTSSEPGTPAVTSVEYGSRADDIEGMKSKLENESVEFTHRKVPGFPLEQLFINDPDGVKVELNYKVDE